MAQVEPPRPVVQPKLVAGPQIVVDPHINAGKEIITLRNDSAAPLEVSLNAAVASQTAGPKITFKADTDTSPGEGASLHPITIPPNKEVKLWAIVTQAATAGTFDLELKNGQTGFDKSIKVIRLPFAIKLDENNPERISLVDDVFTSIVIKNDDPIPYPLVWRLSVEGLEVCGDKINLEANGLGLLQCKPSVPLSLARAQDLFKAQEGTGRLVFYPQTGTGGSNLTSPWKILPIQASLSSLGAFTQQFWGYLLIVLVLLLGGLTSLFLSQALPNRLKRLNIRERLMGTAATTASLGSSVDSSLQVLLRVERSRLYDLLKSRKTLSPDFAALATRCQEAAEKLEKRVALVHQLDVVLGQLNNALSLRPPPSQITEIEALVADAKALLLKTSPTEQELKTVEEAIATVNRKVDIRNQGDAAFGEALAKRVQKVKAEIDQSFSARQAFSELNALVSRPYDELNRVQAGSAIDAAEYSSVDTAVVKLALMKEYTLLREGSKNEEMQQRLKGKAADLAELLSLESAPALRSAQLLLREMQEDVYPNRIAESLLARAASIDMEPDVAYDKTPLEFCICFNNAEVNTSAAREEWTCEWSFGDKLEGMGWNVCHYFLLPRPAFFDFFAKAKQPGFRVQATFRQPDGKPLIDPDTNKPLTIEKVVDVKRSHQEGFFGERSRTEFLKLAAALFIAIFALVAGAKEQLIKLDLLPGLIAVFLVGFGADTIKNLLTTKSESAP